MRRQGEVFKEGERRRSYIYMATGMLTAALQSSPDGFARGWPSSPIAATAPSERYRPTIGFSNGWGLTDRLREVAMNRGGFTLRLTVITARSTIVSLVWQVLKQALASRNYGGRVAFDSRQVRVVSSVDVS